MSRAATTQLLEFGLGDESYCLDIGYVDEIVDAGELTRIPNSPPHVEGVMDLRGRTTAIVDPRKLFDIDGGDGPAGTATDDSSAGRTPGADSGGAATTAGADAARSGRDRIVVFDPDEAGDGGAMGWTVDEVYQVISVDEDDIDESTLAEDEGVRGVVKRDGGFVVWLDPLATR
jgi:purine-binding chemotaxis protein CheW